MALSLGPDFHPSLGAGSRSWWSLFFFLLRVRNSAARGQSWTARRLSSRAPGRGFGRRAPPSFVRLRILPVHAIQHIP